MQTHFATNRATTPVHIKMDVEKQVPPPADTVQSGTEGKLMFAELTNPYKYNPIIVTIPFICLCVIESSAICLCMSL